MVELLLTTTELKECIVCHDRGNCEVTKAPRHLVGLLAVGCLALGISGCGSSSTPRKAAAAAEVGVANPARCPDRWTTTDHSMLNPAPARSGLSDTLVPPGAESMTVCRYAGLNQPVEVGSLERSHVVSGPQLTAFLAFVNMPSWQVISGTAVYNCPADQGSTDLLMFTYSSGPSVDVDVDLEGCSFATNGVRTVNGYEIGMRLTAWVGADRPL